MKRNHIRNFLILFSAAVILLVCAAMIFLYFRISYYHNDEKRRADMAALSTETYSGLLLSMSSPEAFDSGDFLYFRGVPTLKATHQFENLSDTGDYLNSALSCNPDLSSVYICLDTNLIAEPYGFHTSLYRREYEKHLLPFITANPQIQFELMLPNYSLDYWLSLSENKRTEFISTYRNFTNIFAGQPNVTIYFLGFENWLIANPGNYDAYNVCNPSVTSALLALTFRDDYYNLTLANMDERFAGLEAVIAAAGTASRTYDTLSDLDVVFFGDSVIGNFSNSLSIPGVVNGLSGAHTFNLGLGGTGAAASQEPLGNSLNTIVDAFLAQNLSAFEEDSQPFLGLEAYKNASHSGQTCFIISYGLNDYFFGAPVSSEDPYDSDTYCGGIRSAVSKLRSAYPDCRIVLMTPTFCSYYEYGSEKQSETAGILTDYVNAVLELSEELDVDCMDNYSELGIDAANYSVYLSDGCHPNEYGRYIMGRRIAEKLEEMTALFF